MFSIALGEKDNDKAKKILSNALLMLIIISSIIMLIFYLFSEPILFLFGASELSIDYALSYLRIYLIGTFFSFLFTKTGTFGIISLMDVFITQNENTKVKHL